jgi:hypothetical protein
MTGNRENVPLVGATGSLSDRQKNLRRKKWIRFLATNFSAA